MKAWRKLAIVLMLMPLWFAGSLHAAEMQPAEDGIVLVLPEWVNGDGPLYRLYKKEKIAAAQAVPSGSM